VAHDAIVQALSHAEQFREDAQARTWLYKIAFNTALMRQRSSRRAASNQVRARTEVGGSALADEEQSAASCMEAAEAYRGLRVAVTRLPGPYREVIERCVLAEQRSELVAGALGITPSAVRTRVVRARARLREMLEAS
jgi:RNA polymerase sigma-70 factor (ECF subfamily)